MVTRHAWRKIFFALLYLLAMKSALDFLLFMLPTELLPDSEEEADVTFPVDSKDRYCTTHCSIQSRGVRKLNPIN